MKDLESLLLNPEELGTQALYALKIQLEVARHQEIVALRELANDQLIDSLREELMTLLATIQTIIEDLEQSIYDLESKNL